MPSAPSRPDPSTVTSLRHQLTRRKPIDQLQSEAASGVDGEPLRRTLGVWHLTMISVGATLGTGILVVLGTAVPLAGPAVWISFVVAGVAALLSALSYAEMAGAVPTSGSSYSYTYATMGEGIAWVCGWCLVLEYAVSVAAVAVGASEYVDETLRVFGLHLPAALSAPPGDGGVVNLPAAALVLIATAVLLPGARESAWVNTLMVMVKIALLVFFVVVAFSAFRAGNFEPLAPMGAAGVTAAASRLFFSYIGFDAASTAGEEAKNPRRDLPRAIIGSIALITALYILVAIAAIGARPWTSFSSTEASLVRIVVDVTGQPLVALVFSIGAVIAIASVVLTVLYGQTRILLTMARDGLVPKVFGRVSHRTGTPIANTLIVGVVVTIVAALVPLGELADATSIGTLVAFALVNVSVIILRRSQPGLERSYRVPFFPVVPILGTLSCALLAVFLGAGTWIAFAIWMLAGAALYALYGRRHSTLP
ncbi:amino acid/polyamine/organocation transporter (APC superfamily) [Curtobacterium sp. PhB130]|uniref:amino acid permease n=1 Tax=Curtobacterium sp. PhB130 TaxID=2485178 RepID=UPI000F4C2E08|nr:amino acid permease [Curtobacterium sp. PhB130]ROS76257.1 amino acid/polyamine/organocation transporter (APC superfamily) [Curtobacterium sp. PhB130]